VWTPGKSARLGVNVRKYVEYVDQLRKENFGLKLRIYLMEERMEGFNNLGDRGKLIKEKMELKVLCSFSLRVFVHAASVTSKQL
jgi:hypothetical protein